ncbi:type II toxin-antitoxin system RelE/ParE family toxin [Halioxenophilus aromaticivorans]|uniref:Addiction module toxin RelE n=1 Tax=Halioxenophilus aromaticivorans TaxID=1306992 RepID=A0AAV3U9M2_9ALTE
MQGTGGIRKLRWSAHGKGKSGGMRVIYYYHNRGVPLFLLTMFGKGDKANLSKAERNELAKLTHLLCNSYGN